MKSEITIPVCLLRDALNYDPTTGVFTWRKRRSGKSLVGSPAGTKMDGYIVIAAYGKRFTAGRAAWAYVHGSWPGIEFEIDHINCVRDDNRISNLRLARRSNNRCNTGLYQSNTSGVKGVHWHQAGNGWAARIAMNGKTHYLGIFQSKEAAAAAREAAAQSLHGEFARSR